MYLFIYAYMYLFNYAYMYLFIYVPIFLSILYIKVQLNLLQGSGSLPHHYQDYAANQPDHKQGEHPFIHAIFLYKQFNIRVFFSDSSVPDLFHQEHKLYYIFSFPGGIQNSVGIYTTTLVTPLVFGYTSKMKKCLGNGKK